MSIGAVAGRTPTLDCGGDPEVELALLVMKNAQSNEQDCDVEVKGQKARFIAEGDARVQKMRDAADDELRSAYAGAYMTCAVGGVEVIAASMPAFSAAGSSGVADGLGAGAEADAGAAGGAESAESGADVSEVDDAEAASEGGDVEDASGAEEESESLDIDDLFGGTKPEASASPEAVSADAPTATSAPERAPVDGGETTDETAHEAEQDRRRELFEAPSNERALPSSAPAVDAPAAAPPAPDTSGPSGWGKLLEASPRILAEGGGRATSYVATLDGGADAQRDRADAAAHEQSAQVAKMGYDEAREHASRERDVQKSTLDNLRSALSQQHEARMALFRG